MRNPGSIDAIPTGSLEIHFSDHRQASFLTDALNTRSWNWFQNAKLDTRHLLADAAQKRSKSRYYDTILGRERHWTETLGVEFEEGAPISYLLLDLSFGKMDDFASDLRRLSFQYAAIETEAFLEQVLSRRVPYLHQKVALAPTPDLAFWVEPICSKVVIGTLSLGDFRTESLIDLPQLCRAVEAAMDLLADVSLQVIEFSRRLYGLIRKVITQVIRVVCPRTVQPAIHSDGSEERKG